MKKPSYSKRRYWYHVSTTLWKKQVRLYPRNEDESPNRGATEPGGLRICVASSIEQCLTAIPYTLHSTFVVYRTKSPVVARRPRHTKDIFDWEVTKEGWLMKPTNFVKVGTICASDIAAGEKIKNIVEPAACSTNVRTSEKVLGWWKKINVRRYLKPPPISLRP